MARNKTAQGGISLRRKVTAWLAAILLVTMLSTGIATMAGQWTVRSFDMLLADNAVCYTVQNALKDETQAFARYVRQPTSETEQAYTAACTASEQSLAALPFDYARIGVLTLSALDKIYRFPRLQPGCSPISMEEVI